MNLNFNIELADYYHSKSQKARVITEDWMLENMFCPRCGNLSLKQFVNNKPVADFFCSQCGAQYELKSKAGRTGEKVADGAYNTMIERITSRDNPDFFFMSYSRSDFCVTDLTFVPKHFFVPDIIEKRKPLSDTARRAGWIGCNILLHKVPEQGRISIIHNSYIEHRDVIIKKVEKLQRLNTDNMEARGWLLDILNCVNTISNKEFTLSDMYDFEDMLAKKHPYNHNIKAKIRQQLQVLRDKGFVEFAGAGKYIKL